VIARRLAQLSPSARDLVSLAATIGREFSATVLRQASNRGDEPLARDLDELWRRYIIREASGAHGAVTDRYDFTHDKIREAAYEGLNPIRRRWLHRQVAQALENNATESNSNTVSAQVALHYELAGMPEQAIPHLMRAAVAARRVYANETALGHLQKALDLLADMPATEQRAHQELDVLLMMMTPLIALHGYAAAAVGKAKQRAWDLGQQVGNPKQMVSLAGELWNYHAVRGEWSTALTYGEAYLRLAYQSDDPAIVLEAHRCVDETFMFVGEFGAGRIYADWERISYDAQHHCLTLDDRILDAKDQAPLLGFSARLLWYIGYPAQALERMNQALAMAEHLGDPYYIAFALSTATQLQLFCGNGEGCRGYVDRLIELSETHGFAYQLAGGMFFRGYLTANVDGRFDDGIAQMRHGLLQWRNTGAQLWLPYMLGMLAETCLRAGWIKDGLAVVSEALALGFQNRDRFWEAELHRLKGELIRASVAPDEAKSGVLAEAEKSFQEAMLLAQYQGSKALELRVATSLARLWQARGNHEAAQAVLNLVYSWFSEGFNTADLAQAYELLEQHDRDDHVLIVKRPQHRLN
jgi:predicted ATPase